MIPEEEYDVIVLGTGLKESTIAGLLSQQGNKRVLQLDRNDYYGGDEGASLLQPDLFEKFQAGDRAIRYGKCDDYIDLIPKLVLARGKFCKMLVPLLIKSGDIAEFTRIDGCYYCMDSSSIAKVPANDKECLATAAMSLFEKRRFKNFFVFAVQYDPADSATHQDRDLANLTMRELYVQFSLTPASQQLASRGMALESDDAHMDLPAAPTVAKIRTHYESYGDYGKSPFIYPKCSLGKLPEKMQGGATTILGQAVDGILMNDQGEACGVRSGDSKATAKMVIGDPSYFPTNKVRSTGQVVRCICVLKHPILATKSAGSYQIILRGADFGRSNDVHVCCNGIAAKDHYYAVVSTMVENANDPEEDLKAGLDILEPIEEKFISVVDFMEPVEDGLADKCFISKSLDATSHFESDCDDVLSLYKRVTGEDLDLDSIQSSP